MPIVHSHRRIITYRACTAGNVTNVVIVVVGGGYYYYLQTSSTMPMLYMLPLKLCRVTFVNPALLLIDGQRDTYDRLVM